ncbi:hypothetical protein AAVH_25034 [Aphelenchoides avenae]|nr:hypothetical protein AAVH_25034 [Aphelenchus avenae]
MVLAAFECKPSDIRVKRQWGGGGWGGGWGGPRTVNVDVNREVIQQNPWGGQTIYDVNVDRQYSTWG